MKKLLSLVLAIFAFSLLSLSQTPAPSPTPAPTPSPEANAGLHFEVSAAYQKQTTSGLQATVIQARLPLTPRWSAGYEQIQIPAASAQLYLAGVEFREVLGHIIKSQAAKVNLNLIQVYADFGFGTRRDSLGNNPAFAYGVKGGADFPIGTIGGGTLAAGASFGYIGIPSPGAAGGPKRFVFTDTVQVSPTLSFRF